MPNYDVERETIDGGYLVICFQCEREFEAVRYDAMFCSSTCRSRHRRSLQQLDKDIDKTKILVNKLISRMPRRGGSNIYRTLTSLRNRIDSALALVEGEDGL